MIVKHEWSTKANCLGRPTNHFFDIYEASVESDAKFAKDIDELCLTCKAQAQCLAFAATHREWGVWGGVYFEDGKISKYYNKHKSNENWFNVWTNATLDK